MASAALVPVILRPPRWTPARLFAMGEPGVWYDPSDLNTLFQDSAGTTPVTAVEQAVGLILDKSRGLAIGTEQLTGSGTTSGGWAYSASNVITRNSASSGNAIAQTLAVAGRCYLINFTVTNLSGDTFFFRCGGTSSGNITANGSYTFRLVAASASSVFNVAPWAGTAGEVTITLQSIREIAGLHAIQPTAVSRGVLRNRYNLLTYSEDFSNAVWVKSDGATVTANAVTAPDGTLTADQIDLAASELSRVQQPVYILSAAYTFYLWLRVASGTADIRLGHSAALTTVTVTSTWQRFPVTTTTADPNFTIRNAAAGGAKTVYAWGADLRAANDTVYPYQRIAASTDYDADTSKFPLYIQCDGSDDSYYTPANLDLSSTDKATVFAGVTKLSDAALGIIAELSPSVSTNNGSFYLLTQSGGYESGSKGTSASYASVAAGYAAPSSIVASSALDIANDGNVIRLNGTQAASAAGDQGTGNFGSYPLYIARRNNASLPFNGCLYQLLVRGAQSSAAEINSTERFIANQKMLRPL